jgi:hypothetical protein
MNDPGLRTRSRRAARGVEALALVTAEGAR